MTHSDIAHLASVFHRLQEQETPLTLPVEQSHFYLELPTPIPPKPTMDQQYRLKLADLADLGCVTFLEHREHLSDPEITQCSDTIPVEVGTVVEAAQ